MLDLFARWNQACGRRLPKMILLVEPVVKTMLAFLVKPNYSPGTGLFQLQPWTSSKRFFFSYHMEDNEIEVSIVAER